MLRREGQREGQEGGSGGGGCRYVNGGEEGGAAKEERGGWDLLHGRVTSKQPVRKIFALVAGHRTRMMYI